MSKKQDEQLRKEIVKILETHKKATAHPYATKIWANELIKLILSKYIEKSRVLEAIGEIEEVGKGTETHVENILRTPPHKIRDKFRAELKTQLGLEEK